jgi:hypothetical protein
MLDLIERDPVLLALLAVSLIPVEARKRIADVYYLLYVQMSIHCVRATHFMATVGQSGEVSEETTTLRSAVEFSRA